MMEDGPYIMVAPNGARRGKADHPNLPIAPEELAAEAIRSREAGAAVFHLHVRDGDGEHSLDPGLYEAALRAVRGAVGDDLVLQITTEAVGRFSAETQMETVRAVRPEAVSVALREILPDDDHEPAARDFFAWMKGEGIWPQIILYDQNDVVRFVALHMLGAFAVGVPSVLLVLGRYAEGQRSEPADLDPFLDALKPIRDRVDWSICAFGPQENACIARAISEGGNARVGFENNLYLPDGDLADYPADLVRLAADSARAAGRPPVDAATLRGRIAGWL